MTQANSEQAESGQSVANGERSQRRKGIYLLPNLITSAALFAGFYAVMAANIGRFEAAGLAIFIAGILDGLDGRVARMTSTESDFGKEYDSLSDMIVFGMAPALIMFAWGLQFAAEYGVWWGRFGWLCAFFYTAMAALRLARFNTVASDDKKHFAGLPSPSGAGLVVFSIWFAEDMGLTASELVFPAMLITVIAGALMVSNIRYRSFKDFNLSGKVSMVVMIMTILLMVLIAVDPPKVLFACAVIYCSSGPILALFDWRKEKLQSR